MKNRWFWLSVMLISIIAFSYWVLQRGVWKNLAFFWSNTYATIIYVCLALGIILIPSWRHIGKWIRKIKYPFYFLFLPIAIFPLIRCYFKIPYIFCKACPRPCPWGVMRPVFTPAFLVQNLDVRLWCSKMCPIGTLQDAQSTVCRARVHLSRWTLHVRWFVLAFTIFIVSMTWINPLGGQAFLIGRYHWVLGTVIISIIIFILSFFIPRFWCRWFCPIGSVGDLGLTVTRFFKKRVKSKRHGTNLK